MLTSSSELQGAKPALLASSFRFFFGLEMEGFHWLKGGFDLPCTRETHLFVQKVTYAPADVRTEMSFGCPEDLDFLLPSICLRIFLFAPVGFKGNVSLLDLLFPGVLTKWKLLI